MKTQLLLFICIFISFGSKAQLYQKNYQSPQKHFKNANLANINDGSNDIVIASNLLDPASNEFEPVLKRVDETGAVVWSKNYENTSLQGIRVFDIENYFDWILMTGAANVGGINRVFIAKIEAFSGNVLEINYYDVAGPTFNATGLKIISTSSDATGSGAADNGFLVAGYFSNCTNLDPNCTLNAGFVLRTDTNLNTIWSRELESIVQGSTLDYDFINGVVETSDGFVLTGSVTGENSNGQPQQGVLAHKIDFEGDFLWDSSYIRGNSNDVSVDGIYDPNTDDIYLLCNYSNFHHFGVTVLDNSNGNIDANSSWYVNEIDFELDFYGFSLLRSIASTNNLVVKGYRREYFNPNTSTVDQTNTILFEFEKSTGNQVGNAFQHLMEFNEMPGDDYNFWDFQMPLIYYPDIAILSNTSSGDFYHLVGYRQGSAADGSLANIELIKMDSQNENSCDNLITDFTTNPLGTVTAITDVSSGQVTITPSASSLVDDSISVDSDSCDPTVSSESFDKKSIKVYPNPTQGQIYIESDHLANIKIYTITGKLVKEFNSYNNSTGLNFEDLQSGIYFMYLETNDHSRHSFKIIKK